MGSLYSEIRTWLHAVPAWIKLAVLAVAGTALFLTDNQTALWASAAACCTLFVSLGRAAWPARRLVIGVVIAVALIAAFHAFMGTLSVGIVSALRLLSASLLGIALTLTTRTGELLHVLEQVLSPLRRFGVKTESLALQLALMLRFTEHFFVQWKRLDDAHRVRTGKPGGLRILAPLTIQMLRSARRVADTLDVRLGR